LLLLLLLLIITTMADDNAETSTVLALHADFKRRQRRTKWIRDVAASVIGRNAKAATAIVVIMENNDSAFFTDSFTGPTGVVDHRNLPRSERKIFDHQRVKNCIWNHYLSPTPLFNGREFDTMFRISRPRFQRIMEDIAATGDPFYLSTVDAWGKVGSSFEARLLLPLKSMAYGVPPHCFRDYFEMSKSLARMCCIKFDQVIKAIYQQEYLRCPDSQDLKRINDIHKAVHNFDGMFGSLDCMHTYWKNCPIAWQGSYKGKEKNRQLSLKQSLIITCGFGMLPMVMREQ
jgi:Plant transposon protein